jgi:two-component system sensor kinase FixL
VSTAKYNGKTIYVNVIHNLTRQGNAEERLQPNADDLEQVVAERTHFLQNVVQTLEQAREEVDTSLTKEKEVSQLKSRFVSMASHEFRTPLTNIQLSASLIECYFDKLDKQKIFDHITKIKLAVGNLTEVLNDFLSVERIEDGKASPIYREFDLLQFCEDIIDVMKIQLLQGQHITYSHLSKNKTVRLDASMLQHILVNLISNAIKYSGNNGLIEVITNIDKYSFTIQVRDNGIGIPTGDQVHLFEAFFRACNTTKIQGTGLGLNIVKRYTDLMNGTINVASSENSGTTFTLTFPVNS